uniref:Polyprotein n=1 Tax=Yunnan pine nepovirus TaxID=3115771 RepID=A0AAT9JAQ1_9SECO
MGFRDLFGGTICNKIKEKLEVVSGYNLYLEGVFSRLAALPDAAKQDVWSQFWATCDAGKHYSAVTHSALFQEEGRKNLMGPKRRSGSHGPVPTGALPCIWEGRHLEGREEKVKEYEAILREAYNDSTFPQVPLCGNLEEACGYTTAELRRQYQVLCYGSRVSAEEKISFELWLQVGFVCETLPCKKYSKEIWPNIRVYTGSLKDFDPDSNSEYWFATRCWYEMPPEIDFYRYFMSARVWEQNPRFYQHDQLADLGHPKKQFDKCKFALRVKRSKGASCFASYPPLGVDEIAYQACLWSWETLSLEEAGEEDVFEDASSELCALECNTLSSVTAADYLAFCGFWELQHMCDMILAQLPVSIKAGDQEDLERQTDLLESSQGGEIATTSSFIRALQNKTREVRGKKFERSTEGKVQRQASLELNKHDIFLAHTMWENFRKKDIVKSYAGKDPSVTKTCMDLTNTEEIVRYPGREMQRTVDHVLTAQVFTVLQRPSENLIRKLAEEGWKEAKSVCVNLHIRSYVPVHTPLYAFCVVMWGHTENPTTAALCGAYVYLGDQEASVLELPLLCNYLGSSLQDFEAYKRSLLLSTVFFGPSGLREGQPVYGITAVEFTEYLPSSKGNLTHEKDSWNAMLKRYGGEKGRFLAGFNVVDAIESAKSEVCQFPDFQMEAVPAHQPIVREFGGKQSVVKRTSSLRVESFGAFKAGNVAKGDIFRAGPLCDTQRSGAGTSSSQELQGEEPRISKGWIRASSRSPSSFVFIEHIELPTAPTQGQILGVVDILAEIHATASVTVAKWAHQGYIDTDLDIVCHLPSNQYMGLALWFVFDACDRIPSTISKTLDLELARSLPTHLYVVRDETTSSFKLGLHRLLGQSIHFAGNGMVHPRLFVVAATSAVLPASVKGAFCIECFADELQYPRGLATQSVLQYPVDASKLEDLDFFLPPQSVALGTANGIEFSLAFATANTGGSLRAYHYACGLLSHFLGVGGELDFTIRVTSSVFVTAKMRVAMWNALVSDSAMALLPYVDVEVNQRASLLIQTPYYSTGCFGDTGAKLIVQFLCSPFAPEALESSFTFMVHIHGLKPHLPLCRAIDYTQRFGWFIATAFTGTGTDPFFLSIPSRCVDLTHTGATITNMKNAFSILCATTCAHWGKVVLHISWTSTKDKTVSTAEGYTNIYPVRGPPAESSAAHRGGTDHYGPLQGSAAVPFEFGTFAGPTPMRSLSPANENWVNFYTNRAVTLSGIYVDIEVLPGFKFYGRAAGPFTA